MKRLAMTIPIQQQSLYEQRRWFAELEELGYTDLWSSEAYGVDGFTPLAIASCYAPSVRLGCACFPVQTRGPALMAMSAAGLAQAAPGRFVMGIGSSSQPVVELWNDVPFEKPYQYTRDMTRFLRAALRGEKVHQKYETFSVQGFQLQGELTPPPPIFIAALREGMLKLAGNEGDGVILNWIGVEDVERVVSIVKAAGRSVEIALRILICPIADPEDARNACRRAIAGTLTVPTYKVHQQWLGRGELLHDMWNCWQQGDRKGALHAIPDEVIDALVVHGSPQQCQAHIQQFFDSGIDTVIAAFVESVDVQQASRELVFTPRQYSA